jgi:hypothetical protein
VLAGEERHQHIAFPQGKGPDDHRGRAPEGHVTR